MAITLSSPSATLSKLPGGAYVDAVVVVADEQQRRVDLFLLVVDGQSQPLVIEPCQRALMPRSSPALASPKPLSLGVAIQDHQR